MWSKYGKTLAALLGAVVMAGIVTYQQVAAEGVTPSEWVMVVISVFSVITVWAAANVPAFSKAKTFVGAMFVVLNLLVAVITGGITGDEWLLLVVNFLSALGVAGAPAVSTLTASPMASAPARFSGK